MTAVAEPKNTENLMCDHNRSCSHMLCDWCVSLTFHRETVIVHMFRGCDQLHYPRACAVLGVSTEDEVRQEGRRAGEVSKCTRCDSLAQNHVYESYYERVCTMWSTSHVLRRGKIPFAMRTMCMTSWYPKQWDPFKLATQLYLQNDWLVGGQFHVSYMFTQAPEGPLIWC